MNLLQLNSTKLKLEYLKSGFRYKKKDISTDEKMFSTLEFDFFRVQLKFAFRIRPHATMCRSKAKQKSSGLR